MEKTDIKILIVDDEKDILESLQTHLQLDGYNVDVCNSAAEAIDLFRKKTHHVVLSDINMPDIDGLELLEKVKQIRGDTIVIMITAYTTVTKVLASRFHGAMDYVLKPFRDLEEVDQAINRAFEFIERWNHIVSETQVKKNEKT